MIGSDLDEGTEVGRLLRTPSVPSQLCRCIIAGKTSDSSGVNGGHWAVRVKKWWVIGAKSRSTDSIEKHGARKWNPRRAETGTRETRQVNGV